MRRRAPEIVLIPGFDVSVHHPTEGELDGDLEVGPRLTIAFDEDTPVEVRDRIQAWVVDRTKGHYDLNTIMVDKIRRGIRSRLLQFVEMGQLRRVLSPMGWEWRAS